MKEMKEENSSRKSTQYLILGVAVIILLVIGFFWYSDRANLKVEEVADTDDKISFLGSGGLYQSPYGDFHFTLPYSFTISRIEDSEGETILFRGEDEKRSFQIYLLYLEEDVQITPEKIRADLPDLDFREPQVISVDGVQAVVFLSRVGSLDTREVWMAKGRNLYQISTYVEFDEDMVEILSNWKWVN